MESGFAQREALNIARLVAKKKERGGEGGRKQKAISPEAELGFKERYIWPLTSVALGHK